MSQGRYVWIAGKKVYLNPEQQKERDKLINKERYRARQEKICGQPDYRRCNELSEVSAVVLSEFVLLSENVCVPSYRAASWPDATGRAGPP